MLEASVPFPDFSLPDQSGRTYRLADYAEQWLVVYFYPKDTTSACTLEAVDFTAALPSFAAQKAAVLGVSPDSVKSHAGFTTKKALGVTLLSDPEHSLLAAAGVWQKRSSTAKSTWVWCAAPASWTPRASCGRAGAGSGCRSTCKPFWQGWRRCAQKHKKLPGVAPGSRP